MLLTTMQRLGPKLGPCNAAAFRGASIQFACNPERNYHMLASSRASDRLLRAAIQPYHLRQNSQFRPGTEPEYNGGIRHIFKSWNRSGPKWSYWNQSNSRLNIGIGIGIVSVISLDKSLSNDVYPVDTTIHKLQPDKGADTFENGLYASSQQEEQLLFEKYRHSKTSESPLLVRFFYYIKFTLSDYVVSPLHTVVRFLELSCLLFPLVLLAPMCWLGPKDKHSVDKTRAGAKLWYRYLRWTAEAAGATFIKLGQWAASRTDIFPKPLCDQLGKLHSNARAHPLSKTKVILSRSFGMPFEDIFDEFQEVPVGVGAIAQVHLAKLSEKAIAKARAEEKNMESADIFVSSGKRDSFWESVVITEQHGNQISPQQAVAIKVLHPNVEVKVNRDLRIMSFFANLINVIPTMEWLSLPDEVEQFSILMRLQLDLRIEALNLAKFRYNFRNRLDIHFPKPFMSFSTRDVLVEEYVKAVPMSKMLSLKDNFGKNLSKEISDKGLDAFLQMLILDNFVHADLHPGNMLVRFYKNEMFKHEKEYKIVKSSNETETNKITEDLLALGDNSDAWCQKLESLYENGYHAEVCFLDVGLITELNHDDRVNFIDLFKALTEFDGYKAGELMAERSRTPETVVNKEIFALKVEKLVNRMKERTFTLGNISIGDLLDQVLSMVRSHHVRMEGDFITVIVAILLLEGIGRQLDPQLDLFASSLPVLRKLSVSKEGREILQNEDALNMIKVWLALEVRQLIHASIQDVRIVFQGSELEGMKKKRRTLSFNVHTLFVRQQKLSCPTRIHILTFRFMHW